MQKILITTSSFGEFDESVIGELEERGYNTILNPYKRKLTEDEIYNLVKKYNPIGIIAGVEPLTSKVLNECDNLKIISRCGIGTDNVDKKAAKNNNIRITNTSKGPVKAVAELTIGLIISLLREVNLVDRKLRNDEWYRPKGNLLSEKCVGIIGCGNIGSKVAELVSSFNCDIIGYDPFLEDHKNINLVSLDKLQDKADVITLHIPANKKNYNFVDKDFIDSLTKKSYLINTSRGEVIDESAIIQALKTNKLSGVGFDVFKNEPYKGKLKKFENTVLTSHIGSYAKEARIQMEKDAVKNLLAEIE